MKTVIHQYIHQKINQDPLNPTHWLGGSYSILQLEQIVYIRYTQSILSCFKTNKKHKTVLTFGRNWIHQLDPTVTIIGTSLMFL